MEVTELEPEEIRPSEEFPYNSLTEYFASLDEPQKIKFCRDIKESWNQAMQKMYNDVSKTYFDELACRATTMEQINALRQGLQIFKTFEKEIYKYIFIHKQKVAKLQEKSKMRNI